MKMVRSPTLRRILLVFRESPFFNIPAGINFASELYYVRQYFEHYFRSGSRYEKVCFSCSEGCLYP